MKYEIELSEIETLNVSKLDKTVEYDEIDTHVGIKEEEYYNDTGVLEMDYNEFKKCLDFAAEYMLEEEENTLEIIFTGYYEFKGIELKATGYFKKVADKIEIEYEVC